MRSTGLKLMVHVLFTQFKLNSLCWEGASFRLSRLVSVLRKLWAPSKLFVQLPHR